MDNTIEHFLAYLEVWTLSGNYGSARAYTHMVYDRMRDEPFWFFNEHDAQEFRQKLAKQRLEAETLRLTTAK